MTCKQRPAWATLAFVLLCLPASAQPPAPAALPSGPAASPNAAAIAPAPTAAPAATGVAAVVNGQPIPEATVQRALERFPEGRRPQARPELMDYLIDNLLIEQYLQQRGVEVTKAEIDKKIADMRTEVAKKKMTLEDALKEIKMTEAELRDNVIAPDLRWEKFVTSQATEATLHKLFDDNKEVFDGSAVHARHILLSPPPGDAAAAEKAQAQLAQIRKDIEAKVAEGLAKLPANTEPLKKEQERTRLLVQAFSEAARARSECPSKTNGGDVGYFHRVGSMVEPFSRAAFALKPFQISEVVKTTFGYHLILVDDRRAGRAITYDDATKAMAREYFADRLRDMLASQIRQKSTIVITPVGKK